MSTLDRRQYVESLLFLETHERTLRELRALIDRSREARSIGLRENITQNYESGTQSRRGEWVVTII